ncbi:MAG: Sau3AI family type II restriction endonuclease, partial [Eubacteriales bacterium]
AKSIEAYAKKLTGKTFYEILDEQNIDDETRRKIIADYGNPRRKGGLGNFLEEIYFSYKANSDSRADFHEVGIELKASPYEINTKKQYRAGERLVLSMIDYNHPVEFELLTSHLWEKMQKILLVYYFRTKEISDKLNYRIDYTSLFSPEENDLEIIKADYRKIVNKIAEGKAHELSEGDTLYLAASTKGATAASSFATQYYNPNEKAKKRAFSFKQSYMHTVLNNLIHKSLEETERIITDSTALKTKTLEDFILESLDEYKGISDRNLCNLFNREYNNNKAQWVDLTYRMLGIKSNKAEEFSKANIVVKSIRIEENGSIKESMSFPSFDFKKIIDEEWEESSVYRYFDETKFLFVVYQKQGDTYILNKAKFWNMPIKDLDGDVYTCWKSTCDTIRNGITFTLTKKGIENNLPGRKDNPIMHVRPHATKSAYKLNDGTCYGNLQRDAYELPDGQWMTRQCFWLNNSYILDQLNL